MAEEYRLPELSSFRPRLAELDAAMANPDFYADGRKAAVLSKEQQRLAETMAKVGRFNALRGQIAEVEEMLRDPAADAEITPICGTHPRVQITTGTRPERHFSVNFPAPARVCRVADEAL